MTKWTPRAGLAGAALTLVVCAPAEPEPDFDVAHETERLLIGTDFDAPLCQGALALLDAQLAELERRFAHAPPRKLHAVLYDRPAEICGGIRGGVPACYVSGVAHGEWEKMSHELVHAYLHALNPRPVPLLDEGFAVAHDGRVTQTYEDVALAPLLTRGYEEIDAREYLAAGHFMAWLSRERGDEALFELLLRAEAGMEQETIESLAEELLGARLSALELEFRARARELSPGSGVFACAGGQPIEWRGASIELAPALTCDDAGTLLRLGDGPAQGWRRYTVTLPAGDYALRVDGARGALQRCLDRPADAATLEPTPPPALADWGESWNNALYHHGFNGDALTPGAAEQLSLPAGTYTLWIGSALGEGDSDDGPPRLSLTPR